MALSFAFQGRDLQQCLPTCGCEMHSDDAIAHLQPPNIFFRVSGKYSRHKLRCVWGKRGKFARMQGLLSVHNRFFQGCDLMRPFGGVKKSCISNHVSVFEETENRSLTVTGGNYKSAACSDVTYRNAANLLKM